MTGSPNGEQVDRNRPPPGRAFVAYIVAVCLVGALAFAILVRQPEGFRSLTVSSLLVAGLVVLGEVMPVLTPVRWDANGISTASAFLFALLLSTGPALPVLLIVAATILADVGRGRAWWRTVFNAMQYVISWAAAAGVLALLLHPASPSHPRLITGEDLPAILLAGLAYFAVNEVLVSAAVALVGQAPLWKVLRHDLPSETLAGSALLAIAPALVVVMQRSAWLVPLLLVPLAAVYITVSLFTERDARAGHDALTGLANREKLYATTAQLLDTGRPCALLLLDLDRFKEVNDTLGHHVGDELLIGVARRLRGLVTGDDLVSRLGGDEFAVLVPDVDDPAHAMSVAMRLVGGLSEPFAHDQLLLAVEASIGIAMAPSDAGDVETLMQRADVAMYQAKAEHGGVRFYDSAEDRHSSERLALLGELRRAIDQGQLDLHYQVKADARTGRIAGLEALVRWEHPRLGQLPPDEFVPLAEQTGLMRPLTEFVLDRALEQLSRWRSAGLEVDVAVNVNAGDLADRAFVPGVRRRLLERGVPAHCLILEVTERVLGRDLERASQGLLDLTARGVRVSLDDFGTGYSSLLRLQELPVAEIKIDRSFVTRLDEGDDAPIVRSIVELGHALGLTVVAEGVETARAWRALARYGCDQVQGWYLGRAIPAEEMTRWLRRHDAGAVMSGVNRSEVAEPCPADSIPAGRDGGGLFAALSTVGAPGGAALSTVGAPGGAGDGRGDAGEVREA